ncbi:MAG: hypothetical protein KA715_10705 [Xanthomonadaceae bacterium]|nr:hypothetical protein [Xanthomonadaceae bacterium]
MMTHSGILFVMSFALLYSIWSMRIRHILLPALIITFGIQAASLSARAATTGSEPDGQHCSRNIKEGKLTLGEKIGKAKRFFVFVEQPLIGIVNTPISAWVSKSLKWFTNQITSYYKDGKFLDVSVFKDWFTSDTISNFSEA